MIYKLNNKEYEVKEITFGEIVKMEKKGVDLLTLGKSNTFSQAVAMISYITGLPQEKVMIECNEHIENGGSIDDIFQCFNCLTESDFFNKVGAKK